MKTFNDFEKIAQRSKVKNRIKLVVLSTLVALASLGIIVRCLTEVASRHGEAVKDTYLLMQISLITIGILTQRQAIQDSFIQIDLRI